MEPGFFLSYWRPWDENSCFVDSWGDYIKDKTMAEYEAGRIGSYIQEVSREQVYAIEEASQRQANAINLQTETLAHIGELQLLEIRKAAKNIGLRISEVRDELSFLNRKMDIALEQQRLSLVLQNDIAQLLKIPDSEKERQHAITLGIKFFVNASKDPDLYDDALEQFLKAEKLMKQDYFVLHRIGCIYLYVPKHLNPELALDYFVRAGKYASVESSPDALRLVNLLNNSINESYTQQTSDPKQILLLAANSYEKAALTSYILGNDNNASVYQEKALSYDNTAKNSFTLAKYLIRSGKVTQAMKRLEWAIDKDPSMMDAIFCDADVVSEPKTIAIVNKKQSELDNLIEETMLDSFPLVNKDKDSFVDVMQRLRLGELATVSDSSSYLDKREKYNNFKNSSKTFLANIAYERETICRRLKKYQEFGLITEAQYNNWMAQLSGGTVGSISEFQQKCAEASTFLDSSLKPGVALDKTGCIIFKINDDKQSGLMCAPFFLGPDKYEMAIKKCSYYHTLPGYNSYPNWYLPSHVELRELLLKIPRLKNKLKDRSSSIWTSSETVISTSYGRVTVVNPFDMSQDYEDNSTIKYAEHYFIPIRKFNLK